MPPCRRTTRRCCAVELTALDDAATGQGSARTARIVELSRRVARPRDVLRRALGAAEQAGVPTADVVIDLKESDVTALREWLAAMTDAD